jgi:hypothetical protein
MSIRTTWSIAWRVSALAIVLGLAPRDKSEANAARLVFEATAVEGEVQRPQVSVFITRQNLNDPYDLELKESFLPKIIEALDNEPF